MGLPVLESTHILNVVGHDMILNIECRAVSNAQICNVNSI